jgi:glycosyltransferase involved in cell wall biosynthesis
MFIQRVIPRYREALFELLAEQCCDAGIKFDLYASQAEMGFAARGTEGDLPWTTKVPVIPVVKARTGVEWQHLPWRRVLDADVVVVPDNVRVLSNVAVICLRKLAGKPVITWGHGVNFQPRWSSGLFAKVRAFILSQASRHLVYTSACIEPMVSQGYDAERIYLSYNAIDASKAVGLSSHHPDVIAFRNQHALGESPCVVFLGSWYAGKRPERIVEFGNALRQQLPDARILVIGGGDGLSVLRSVDAPWLTMLGPLHGRDKFVALSAAYCLAVTGIAGLNILDAMAVGLPVIAPKRSDHSPEIAFIEHGINGYITEDSMAEMAKQAAGLIADSDQLAALQNAARQTAAQLSIANMAQHLLAPVFLELQDVC